MVFLFLGYLLVDWVVGFLEAEMKLKASHTPGKHCIMELHPQHTVLVCFFPSISYRLRAEIKKRHGHTHVIPVCRGLNGAGHPRPYREILSQNKKTKTKKEKAI